MGYILKVSFESEQEYDSLEELKADMNSFFRQASPSEADGELLDWSIIDEDGLEFGQDKKDDIVEEIREQYPKTSHNVDCKKV